jgi:hypothetical protein
MQFGTVSKPLMPAFSKNICRSLRNTANRKGILFSLASLKVKIIRFTTILGYT